MRTASVACGVLGVGGNKGASAVAFSLFRRQVACLCSHFAAHQVRCSATLIGIHRSLQDWLMALWPAWHAFAWTTKGVGGNNGAPAVTFSLSWCQVACQCLFFAAHQVCDTAFALA